MSEVHDQDLMCGPASCWSEYEAADSTVLGVVETASKLNLEFKETLTSGLLPVGLRLPKQVFPCLIVPNIQSY